MIEEAAAKMQAIGWSGVEVRAFTGSFHFKDPDGRISREESRPFKEWVVTFFYIIKPGLTTVKAIGKGKTFAEAITKAKGEAYDKTGRCGVAIHGSSDT